MVIKKTSITMHVNMNVKYYRTMFMNTLLKIHDWNPTGYFFFWDLSLNSTGQLKSN